MKNQKKKSIRFCLQFTIITFFTIGISTEYTNAQTAIEIRGNRNRHQWVKQHFSEENFLLPFSFQYDGKSSFELLTGWNKKSNATTDNNKIQYHQYWIDPQTGLQIQCNATEYLDLPVVEWTVYLKNTGKSNTPILKDIQGLDAVFQRSAQGEFVLHGLKGDFCTADSYEPFDLTLVPGFTKTYAPAKSGKSSDGPNGWPYYNLQMPNGGVILAIGWPGQWSCSFTRDSSRSLAIKAGQQLTNLYLKPGEEIRTPSITMLFWKGKDVVEAQNLWRRYYLAHIIPKFDGLPQQPTLQIQVGAAVADTAYVNQFLQAGIKPDICWRDAGGSNTWYPNDKGPYKGDDAWLNTGDWKIDQRKYPEEFRPYSDWIHRKGINFLLWFEPERIGNPDSWLSKNHPEWLLPGTSHGALLNEGNPEALNWLINHVDSMIKTQGIDWYREDMNGGGPLPAWRKNEQVDRQGINENFYIQGHLAYWDALKQRNPKLRIDACASGGRRNDLETMKRAVPLLRSDFQWQTMPNVIDGNQGHTYGLSFWFPFQGTGVYFYDSYSYRSFYMAGFGMGGLTPENTFAQQKAYAECREIAPLMLLGDYYPLTPYNLQPDQWIAWQFNSPKQGIGVIQAFRRNNCTEATMIFHLRGLESKAWYELKNFDEDVSTRVSGKILVETGLIVKINNKPGSVVITYKKVQ